MIFCKDISLLQQGRNHMRQSQILTCNRSNAKAHKGVIHHVSTPKIPTYSVAIGLLHLPSGTQ
ncbi:hypothetical protein [Prevotella intermedia]|uniref:hypothetical protein n=1 Tax=Prevotella intermedia TaxID=28131 RepID=UPI0012FE26A7|nr:hypothetical protein [Prevotella intermedia]